MKVCFGVQHPDSRPPDTFHGLLKSRIGDGSYDVARIAVAYMTVSGLRTFLGIFPEGVLRKSCWLVGLDDAVTQPGAIDLLLARDDAQVRIASYQAKALRFHPKVFSFEHSNNRRKRVAFVGSANLTAGALAGNGEAVAVLEGEDELDSAGLDRLWADLWKQGHVPRQAELDHYRQLYAQVAELRREIDARTARKKAAIKKTEVLTSDSAELDPSVADTCWIECGYITAMGRELEFKAEQGLFFGLSPTGGPPQDFRFRTSTGDIVRLRMKYQGNHMWRLQLNRNVPEVRTGLRPRLADGTLGRSPYVAVFQRTSEDKQFNLRFIPLSGRAFARLLAASKRNGTVGHTTARQYGWC